MADDRASIHHALLALAAAGEAELESRLAELASPEAVWHVAHPVNDLAGRAAVLEGWLRPLRAALPGCLRRDEIVIGGTSHTGSGRWVATLGHYVGNLIGGLLGVMPTGRLAFLRCGEFYRIEGGQVVEAYLLPDLLDLMRQAGQMPSLPPLGTEMLFPGPASHDGIRPAAAERSAASLALVEAMLADLRSYDPVTFESPNQTGEHGYWHPDMLWYGPAGIGASFTFAGFQRHHRIPFLTAFPDRIGGNHFARFADGDYVASGGWPSMTMTHAGPYLGVPPTGRRLSLRVMDFWRVRDGTIRENWVLLDLLHLLEQMGADVPLGRWPGVLRDGAEHDMVRRRPDAHQAVATTMHQELARALPAGLLRGGPAGRSLMGVRSRPPGPRGQHDARVGGAARSWAGTPGRRNSCTDT